MKPQDKQQFTPDQITRFWIAWNQTAAPELRDLEGTDVAYGDQKTLLRKADINQDVAGSSRFLVLFDLMRDLEELQDTINECILHEQEQRDAYRDECNKWLNTASFDTLELAMDSLQSHEREHARRIRFIHVDRRYAEYRLLRWKHPQDTK